MAAVGRRIGIEPRRAQAGGVEGLDRRPRVIEPGREQRRQADRRRPAGLDRQIIWPGLLRNDADVRGPRGRPFHGLVPRDLDPRAGGEGLQPSGDLQYKAPLARMHVGAMIDDEIGVRWRRSRRLGLGQGLQH